jgi:toxin YoeB
VKLTFEETGWEQYLRLREVDPKAHAKLDELLRECLRHPFTGTGKPEPLKRNLSGFWSRRITREHRLVYFVSGYGDMQTLTIAQCLNHY